MTFFDVFNGDADGLCALQQLRLAQPLESKLVTGVKRDIALLERVKAFAGDQVTVLDVAMEKNVRPLLRLLDEGVRICYFDHHFPGEIPGHPHLEVHIETLPDKGTSLLVDQALEGRHRDWAVVGTFGDNFDAAARKAAKPLDLKTDELDALRKLGIYLNYNGYGATTQDLHVHPEQLFRSINPYRDPLDFIARDENFGLLEAGYRDDMSHASSLAPVLETDRHAAYILPCESWARRVSGVLANRLAWSAPDKAHAMLTQLPEDGFLVSVRAPLSRPEGADLLCLGFPTGGGRKAAAGINRLESGDYEVFLSRFTQAF